MADLVGMDGTALGPFAASHKITKDGRILLVPTPGHVSVVVSGYFPAGDATY